MLGFKSKSEERREIARLEAVKESFLREHTALCEKYHCQMVTVPQILPGGIIRFSMQIDSYWPTKEQMDAAKKEEK